jgi:hypothetical protein
MMIRPKDTDQKNIYKQDRDRSRRAYPLNTRKCEL